MQLLKNILINLSINNNLIINEQELIKYQKEEFDLTNKSQYQILFIRLIDYFESNKNLKNNIDINFINYIYTSLDYICNFSNTNNNEQIENKNAWFTFVSKPLYLEGAKNLYLRMKFLKSKYPVVILITGDEINENDLKILEGIPYIKAPLQSFKNSGSDRFVDTLMKFYAFELIEYDRICVIDSDILPIINIDDWFEKFNFGHIYDGFKVMRYDQNGEAFLTSEGSIFFITPTKNKFQEIINISEILNASNDEQVSYYLFNNHLKYVYLGSIFSEEVNHFGIFPKYWQLKEYDPNLINFSSKELKEYLANLQNIRFNISTNNSYSNLLKTYGYKY